MSIRSVPNDAERRFPSAAFEEWFAAIWAGSDAIPVPECQGNGWNDYIAQRQLALGAWEACRAAESQRQDAAEDALVIERLSQLLAKIAIVVNGPQPKGTLWSYHDLPDKVATLAKEATRYRWLRERATAWEPPAEVLIVGAWCDDPRVLDAAIDAARGGRDG